ncbi:endonuclease V [archaeon]|nr:endonuclease V [archaeon]
MSRRVQRLIPKGWIKLERLVRIQRKLTSKVRIQGPPRWPPRLVAGIDLAYSGGFTFVAIVVVTYPEGRVVSELWAKLPETFPYIPTFLFMREGPPILYALTKLPVDPDLLLVNGHGLLHPRRMGLATYVGVVSGKPSVGVAASLLRGFVVGEDGFVRDKKTGEVLGAVIKRGKRAAYVSPGHLVTLERCIEVVRVLTAEGRCMPKPILLADRLSKVYRPRGHSASLQSFLN